MKKVLLLHGAWHNGKAWSKVEEILQSKGYETEALTIPGNGADDSKDVTFEDYVSYVVEMVEKQSGKVVFVGHSSAGQIMQEALPKVEDKLEKVVFNNAWLLPDGKSQFDFVPDEIKEGMRAGAKASGTGAIPLDPGFARGLLASEADDDTFNKLMSILVDQPLVIMEHAVDAKAFSKMQTPKAMLYNTLDRSVDEGAFLGMFMAWGDNPVIEVVCDHEGLFTAPDAYAEGLIKAIEG